MIRVTASRLELLSRCGYFARSDAQWAEHTSRDATLGTALHSLCEAEINGEVPNDWSRFVELEPEEGRTLAAMWEHAKRHIATHRRAGWRAEVAFAYDPEADVGRELAAKDGHRDYSDVGETEMAGTADLVYMDGDRLVIADWKSGSTFVDAHDATAQLAGLALFACRAYGAEHARIVTLRVTEDGVTETPLDLDMFDLARVSGEIQGRLADVPDAEPAPGPWCAERWCPARAACPATSAALAQVIPADRLARPRDFTLAKPIGSNDEAAWTLTALDLIEEAVKAKRAEAKAWADAHDGIALADGKVYQGTEVVTEKADLSVEGAVEALQALGLGKAIEASTTWTAIKRTGNPALEEQARATLRAIGATRATSFRKYEARAPKGAKRGRAA